MPTSEGKKALTNKRQKAARKKRAIDLRSQVMRAVKSKNTAPEILIRKLVHSLRYRFQLYRSDLPGKPDLAFPKLRSVIFVHGCFWHGHHCARGDRVPKTNRSYWINKIASNKARDRRSIRALRKLGWQPLVVWECQMRDSDRLTDRIRSFLDGSALT
jgi:DNA mismatch endonuclease (patch repair protein)